LLACYVNLNVPLIHGHVQYQVQVLTLWRSGESLAPGNNRNIYQSHTKTGQRAWSVTTVRAKLH